MFSLPPQFNHVEEHSATVIQSMPLLPITASEDAAIEEELEEDKDIDISNQQGGPIFETPLHKPQCSGSTGSHQNHHNYTVTVTRASGPGNTNTNKSNFKGGPGPGPGTGTTQHDDSINTSQTHNSRRNSSEAYVSPVSSATDFPRAAFHNHSNTMLVNGTQIGPQSSHGQQTNSEDLNCDFNNESDPNNDNPNQCTTSEPGAKSRLSGSLLHTVNTHRSHMRLSLRSEISRTHHKGLLGQNAASRRKIASDFAGYNTDSPGGGGGGKSESVTDLGSQENLNILSPGNSTPKAGTLEWTTHLLDKLGKDDLKELNPQDSTQSCCDTPSNSATPTVGPGTGPGQNNNIIGQLNMVNLANLNLCHQPGPDLSVAGVPGALRLPSPGTPGGLVSLSNPLSPLTPGPVPLVPGGPGTQSTTTNSLLVSPWGPGGAQCAGGNGGGNGGPGTPAGTVTGNTTTTNGTVNGNANGPNTVTVSPGGGDYNLKMQAIQECLKKQMDSEDPNIQSNVAMINQLLSDMNARFGGVTTAESVNLMAANQSQAAAINNLQLNHWQNLVTNTAGNPIASVDTSTTPGGTVVTPGNFGQQNSLVNMAASSNPSLNQCPTPQNSINPTANLLLNFPSLSFGNQAQNSPSNCNNISSTNMAAANCSSISGPAAGSLVGAVGTGGNSNPMQQGPFGGGPGGVTALSNPNQMNQVTVGPGPVATDFNSIQSQMTQLSLAQSIQSIQLQQNLHCNLNNMIQQQQQQQQHSSHSSQHHHQNHHHQNHPGGGQNPGGPGNVLHPSMSTQSSLNQNAPDFEPGASDHNWRSSSARHNNQMHHTSSLNSGSGNVPPWHQNHGAQGGQHNGHHPNHHGNSMGGPGTHNNNMSRNNSQNQSGSLVANSHLSKGNSKGHNKNKNKKQQNPNNPNQHQQSNNQWGSGSHYSMNGQNQSHGNSNNHNNNYGPGPGGNPNNNGTNQDGTHNNQRNQGSQNQNPNQQHNNNMNGPGKKQSRKNYSIQFNGNPNINQQQVPWNNGSNNTNMGQGPGGPGPGGQNGGNQNQNYQANGFNFNLSQHATPSPNNGEGGDSSRPSKVIICSGLLN